MSDHAPLCILHIGKTGGSYLRSVLRHNRKRWTQPIDLLGHDATLKSTRRTHGANRRLGLTIRDPATRFVSAFYSRLRQGRPTYQFTWSVDEAAAFHWFSEAETLARALISTDEREKSAAFFAMESIQHIRDGYRPMILLEHGSVVGLFMLTATLAAAGLWKSGDKGPWLPATVWLYLCLAISENLAALSIGTLMLGIFLIFHDDAAQCPVTKRFFDIGFTWLWRFVHGFAHGKAILIDVLFAVGAGVLCVQNLWGGHKYCAGDCERRDQGVMSGHGFSVVFVLR